MAVFAYQLGERNAYILSGADTDSCNVVSFQTVRLTVAFNHVEQCCVVGGLFVGLESCGSVSLSSGLLGVRTVLVSRDESAALWTVDTSTIAVNSCRVGGWRLRVLRGSEALWTIVIILLMHG